MAAGAAAKHDRAEGHHHRAQVHHIIPRRHDALADLKHDPQAPAVLREPQALDAPEPIKGKQVAEFEERLLEVSVLLERAGHLDARKLCQPLLEVGFSRPPAPALLLRFLEADLLLLLIVDELRESRHVGLALSSAAHEVAWPRVDADNELAEHHRRLQSLALRALASGRCEGS
jgi:hypothetical protein